MLNQLNGRLLPEGSPSRLSGLPTASNASLARIGPQVYALIQAFISELDLLASQPFITVCNDVTVIHVFYFAYSTSRRPSTLSSLAYINPNLINSLGQLISRILNARVELRFVKVRYPFMDAYALAQFISLELQQVKWSEVERLLTSHVLPAKVAVGAHTGLSYITGLKVTLSGRLANEPTLPRQTSKRYTIGSFKSHPTAIQTQGQYTAVNSKGTYTVHVIMHQRLLI